MAALILRETGDRPRRSPVPCRGRRVGSHARRPLSLSRRL